MTAVRVKVVCDACDGTGLYQGFAEPEGVAVVCLNCNGTGCAELRYEPFIRRKGRRGIKVVHCSRGTFLGTGVGPATHSVTYADFQNGVMPKRDNE